MSYPRSSFVAALMMLPQVNAELPPLSTLMAQFINRSAAVIAEDPRQVPENTFYQGFMNDLSNGMSEEQTRFLVFDYLKREGFSDVAAVLAEESGHACPSSVTTAPFTEERTLIRERIQSGQISDAIESINAISSDLLREDGELHFRILRQGLVELIREGRVEESLEFAEKHLVDKSDQKQDLIKRLEQTYALLAFDEPEKSPFGFLMANSQKQQLAGCVNEKILSHAGVNPHSKLEEMLQTMVWLEAQMGSHDPRLRLHPEDSAQVANTLFSDDFMEEVTEESL